MPLKNITEEYQCTARAKTTPDGKCHNPKANGTQVCKKHGAMGGRPPQTGLYSGQSKESLNKKIERAATFEKSLNDEIGLMKAVMNEVLEGLKNEESDISDSKTLLKLQTTADSIRKLMETQLKIESEQKFMLSMPDMKLIKAQIAYAVKDVLSEYIKDDNDYQEALKKVQRMLDEGVKILDGEVKESKS